MNTTINEFMVTEETQHQATVTQIEIDLIKEVGDRLTKAGLAKEVLSSYYTNPMIMEAQSFPTEGQRFILNRFFNLQLLGCAAVSVDERFCLIPNGEFKDWLRLFDQRIVPFCIEHRLPK
jgi:hypothetical protein